MSIITLTTDFGTRDTFVGQIKGAILTIAPQVQIVDLTHKIPPQDVMTAAMALEFATGAFPFGAIHVAVVDPCVGSARAAIAVQAGPHIFVGPDNGIFTAVLRCKPCPRIVELTNPSYQTNPVSATFHGRDVFAPAAAHLANGIAIEQLGESIELLVTLDIPTPIVTALGLELRVLHTDRFGNLITNLTRPAFESWKTPTCHHTVSIVVAGQTIEDIRRTFSDVESGQPLAYFGSTGRLEVGVRNGNAAQYLGAGPGDVVLLQQ